MKKQILLRQEWLDSEYEKYLNETAQQDKMKQKIQLATKRYKQGLLRVRPTLDDRINNKELSKKYDISDFDISHKRDLKLAHFGKRR